jgi:hypothetical protein
MNTNHEVISAFLDNEPFEPRALGEALADPAGRELLIDFVLLRHVAQSDEAPATVAATSARPRRTLYALAAAAAIVMALLGGYELGERRSTDGLTPAPEPTRVVQSDPAWVRESRR